VEDEVIKFTKTQIFDIVQIVFDNDKDEALKFMKEHIFKELERRKNAKCHGHSEY
jgi:hypothetical protein